MRRATYSLKPFVHSTRHLRLSKSSTTNPARKMSQLTSPKLIFAPGADSADSQNPQQAAQFQIGTLHLKDLNRDPFLQFHAWFTSPALRSTNPEACTLSTAELPSGRVSARMVYLKELDGRGFVIYSNFGTSRKAADLRTNPYASLTFWWKPLERQVRVEGWTERLARTESQAYYDTRARGSKVGAWASRQSKVLTPLAGEESGGKDDGRAELDGQVRDVEERFRDTEDMSLPVPDFWGGLRLVPDTIEFWQGRESRLHDRFRFSRTLKMEGEGGKVAAQTGHGNWVVERLSP